MSEPTPSLARRVGAALGAAMALGGVFMLLLAIVMPPPGVGTTIIVLLVMVVTPILIPQST